MLFSALLSVVTVYGGLAGASVISSMVVMFLENEYKYEWYLLMKYQT